MRTRRVVTVAAGIALAVGIAGCVGFSAAAGGKPWVAEDVYTGAQAVLSHPRDESAFLQYAHDYTPRQNGRAWITAHRAAILAAGHDACDWLEAQPRHGAALSLLSGRYLDSASGRHAFAPALPMARLVVVSGAWTYLCWPVGETRRLHDVSFGERVLQHVGLGHDSSD